MKRRISFVFVIWTFFVFVASLIPGKALPKSDWMSMFQLDKLIHLCLYFVMCMLMYLSIKHESSKKWTDIRTMTWSAGFAICFGIAMEILQSNLNTGRYFDIFDVLANTIGVLIAMLVIYLKLKK